MKSRREGPLGLYTIGIAALFLAGFLMLVILGARTYRDVAVNQTENNDTRALLSYLSTCVKSSDAAGRISVEESEYGPVLTIANDSGYALQIYQNGEKLLEEYRALGTALQPESADVLGTTATFAVEIQGSDLLKITTDVGSVLLHLRSGEVPE